MPNILAGKYRFVGKPPAASCVAFLDITPMPDEVADLIVLLELLQNVTGAFRPKKPHLRSKNCLQNFFYFSLFGIGLQTPNIPENDERTAARVLLIPQLPFCIEQLRGDGVRGRQYPVL